VRADLPEAPRISAHVNQVTGTQRRTTLGHQPTQVSLVEHVLAALAGLRIDNCLVELDAGEPPGLDGSALGFVQALLTSGVQNQSATREVWFTEEPITLRSGGATLTLHPPAASAEGRLDLTYFLDYGPLAPIIRQVHTQTLMPAPFIENLAGCRTFLLACEAEELRRQGLGTCTTTSDLLVFGPRGPMDNRLRFGNEPARHKILDMIGDLSLLGVDLNGHVVAYRSGHPLNVEMVRVLEQRLAAAAARRAA
jgi:UDP-3-O-acyl-N-acetylglucosamine deacetylase